MPPVWYAGQGSGWKSWTSCWSTLTPRIEEPLILACRISRHSAQTSGDDRETGRLVTVGIYINGQDAWAFMLCNLTPCGEYYGYAKLLTWACKQNTCEGPSCFWRQNEPSLHRQNEPSLHL
jgi:hypothetical protein